jgi:hypothetical protein
MTAAIDSGDAMSQRGAPRRRRGAPRASAQEAAEKRSATLPQSTVFHHASM